MERRGVEDSDVGREREARGGKAREESREKGESISRGDEREEGGKTVEGNEEKGEKGGERGKREGMEEEKRES